MTHLREIIISLADAKVDFVVGGGVACVLQGVERFTLELDGRRIKIASVEKMLEVKEAIDPPRDKDLLDIAALRRLLNDE